MLHVERTASASSTSSTLEAQARVLQASKDVAAALDDAQLALNMMVKVRDDGKGLL